MYLIKYYAPDLLQKLTCGKDSTLTNSKCHSLVQKLARSYSTCYVSLKLNVCALPLKNNVRNVKCSNSWHSSYEYRQFYMHGDREVGNTVNTAAYFILASHHDMVVEKHFLCRNKIIMYCTA